MANGTSSCQKRIQGVSRNEPPASQSSIGQRAQRLVEAEGHVPGLAGEDHEHRREFGAEHAARHQRHEENERDREETQDRHRLQDVEHRYQQFFSARALGGPGRVGEREQQRDHQRREHAQRRAGRIYRQMHGIERQRRSRNFRHRRQQPAAGLGEKRQDANHDHDGNDVPARGEVAHECERLGSSCRGVAHRSRSVAQPSYKFCTTNRRIDRSSVNADPRTPQRPRAVSAARTSRAGAVCSAGRNSGVARRCSAAASQLCETGCGAIRCRSRRHDAPDSQIPAAAGGACARSAADPSPRWRPVRCGAAHCARSADNRYAHRAAWRAMRRPCRRPR